MENGDTPAALQQASMHASARPSRLSRRTMAADIQGTPTDVADGSDTEAIAKHSKAALSEAGDGNATDATAAANEVGSAAETAIVNSEAGAAPESLANLQPGAVSEPLAISEAGAAAAADGQEAVEEVAEEAAAAIPAEIQDKILLQRLADRSAVNAPSDAIGDALAAYNILRAFSWQIRLSPFAFEELCAALFNPNPSPLMDELHICLIRSLAFDENKAERAERGLNLGSLDAMSWPEFVWEYLYMHEDDLRHHRYTQLQPKQADNNDAAAKQRASLPATEEAFKGGLSDQGTKTSITITGRSPSKLARAAAKGPARAAANSPSGAVSNSPSGAVVSGPAASSGNLTEGIASLRAIMKRQPFRHKSQVEYYALAPGIKAAILVSLVNDLLDISSVRHEIDKREQGSQWVAGKGGAGGSFPMRSEEERARRADATSDAEGDSDNSEAQPRAKAEVFEDDGNTDLCVLCGLGGSLLCCDGCPAAYHMRCIGETAKSIPEGEWLCPECNVGGRGEAAGLRIPRAGQNQHKQPHWMCHGCLFRSARPGPEDIGRDALEEGPVPMDKWTGEVAAAEAKALRKIKGEERPHPTSVQALQDPPQVKELASLSAEGYVNRYRNSWTAAVAATKTFVDDIARKRGRPPAGGGGRVSIPMADLPVPVPLSKFQWPSSAGKGQRGNLVRCGQCHMCRNPLMKKPCLNPIVPRGLDGLGDEGTSAPKLMTIAHYAMKLEREVWGVLEGPWGSDTWMSWRRDWAQRVRTATVAEPVAHAILELESHLRPTALSPSWGSQGKPQLIGASARKGPAGSRATPKPGKEPAVATASKSGRLSTAVSSGRNDTFSSKPRRNYKEDSDSGPSESDEEEQDPFAAGDDDDVSIVDNQGQSGLKGWALNQRSKWGTSFKGSTRLPQDAAKRLARRGGIVRVTGAKYNTKQLVLQARLAWRGAMQGARTASELALQLRRLDSFIQWEALKRPLDADNPYASAEILQRRPAATGTGWDYLVLMGPAEGLANGLGSALGPRQPLQPLMTVPGQVAMTQQAMSQQQKPAQQLPAFNFQKPQHTQQQDGMVNAPVVQSDQLAIGIHSSQPSANGPVSVALPKQRLSGTAEADHMSGANLGSNPQLGLDSAQPGSVQGRQTQSAALQGLPNEHANASGLSAFAAQNMAQTHAQTEPAAPPAAATEAAAAVQLPPNPQQFSNQPPARAQQGSLAGLNQAAQPDPSPSPQGLPTQAGGLSSLVPTPQQQQPGCGQTLAEPQMQSGKSAGVGSSREGTPAAKGQGTWLHESTLPLWLIRVYEEKRRRDVAMVAARAAQQAQRDANAASRGLALLGAPWRSDSSQGLPASSSAFKTKRQEAKAAADAAAAAAADACAVCDKLYGEDADRDDTWIACDRCNRWYHGFCVDMTQEMVDGVEDKKWECPECTALKTERRRIAGERARQKRASQSKLGSAPSGSDAGLDHQSSGPGWETKKSRRPKAAPKSGKKRKAAEAAGTVGEAEEEGAEPVELYCICRQPDDGLRSFVECDTCNEWFHTDCVGVNLEDMAEDEKFFCPLCQRAAAQKLRKEQRRAEAEAAAELERQLKDAQAARKAKLAELDMSNWPRNWQAAIQRVLEGVLKLPEAALFAEPVPMDEVPGYREQISNPMDLGTVLGRAKADAYDTPLEALTDVRQVWQNCRIFNAEGSEIWNICQEAEDAFDVSWSSARLPLPPRPPLPPSLLPKKKSKAGSKRQRDNAGDVSSSGAQASSSGRQQKVPRHRQGAALEADATAGQSNGASAQKRRLVVLPPKLPEKDHWEDSEPSDPEISDSDESQPHGRAQKIKLKIKGSKSSQRQQETNSAARSSPAELSQAQKVVKGVLKLKAAAPFSRPVNEEEVPGYGAAVQQPMDLLTVSTKLKDGQYSSLGEVLGDVDLIWSNCRSFNEPDSEICELADQAQQAFRMRWQQEGLPTVTPIAPPLRKKQSGKKRALEAGADATLLDEQQLKKSKKAKGYDSEAAEADSAAELSKAQKVVRGLMKLKVAAAFSIPVSEEDVPGYSLVVQNPMDLGTVLEKLKEGGYSSAGEVYSDVELIWQNCHTFNEPDSDICIAASEAQQAFHDRWQQQGLPHQQVKPVKKKSDKAGKQAGAMEADDAISDEKKKGGRAGKQAAVDDSASKGKQQSNVLVKSGKKQHPKASISKGEKVEDNPSSSARIDAVRGKTDKAASRRESQDGRKSMAGKPQQTAKRKREEQPDNDDDHPQASKKSKGKADQHSKKSKGAPDQHLAPEKMSASARLRKGLPPTPPLRVSPRAGNAEAAVDDSDAAAATNASSDDLSSKAKGKSAKGKVKVDGASQHEELKDSRNSDQPVARRTSGRLK